MRPDYIQIIEENPSFTGDLIFVDIKDANPNLDVPFEQAYHITDTGTWTKVIYVYLQCYPNGYWAKY